MKRLNNIDLLKFICAVLVVFLHMGTPYQQYILPLTRCAVPCFLIISGYFIFNADDAKFQARLKKNITSNPQLSSSASFLRLNVLSSLN